MKKKSLIAIDFLAVIITVAFSIAMWLIKDKVSDYLGISLLGVLITCFVSNSSILLPSASLFIVMQAATIINPLLVSIVAAIGTTLGELVGFCLGRFGGNVIQNKKIDEIEKKFHKKPYFIVFLFSLLPLPVFDIIGILSGACKINILKFILCCFAGKFIKIIFYAFFGKFLMQFVSFNF